MGLLILPYHVRDLSPFPCQWELRQQLQQQGPLAVMAVMAWSVLLLLLCPWLHLYRGLGHGLCLFPDLFLFRPQLLEMTLRSFRLC